MDLFHALGEDVLRRRCFIEGDRDAQFSVGCMLLADAVADADPDVDVMVGLESAPTTDNVNAHAFAIKSTVKEQRATFRVS